MSEPNLYPSRNLSLSERITRLETSTASISGDLRMIEMHVARAEAHLLRYEQKEASWTRPDLLVHMIEDDSDNYTGSWKVT